MHLPEIRLQNGCALQLRFFWHCLSHLLFFLTGTLIHDVTRAHRRFFFLDILRFSLTENEETIPAQCRTIKRRIRFLGLCATVARGVLQRLALIECNTQKSLIFLAAHQSNHLLFSDAVLFDPLEAGLYEQSVGFVELKHGCRGVVCTFFEFPFAGNSPVKI